MLRTESAPAGHDVNQLLSECEPLLVRLVKLRLRGRPADVLDDVCQQVRLHLWQHSLPRFDPAQASLTTFAYVCVNRRITRELRRLDGRPPTSPIDFDLPAPDTAPDRSIEQLADAILRAPEAYLSDLGASILRAVTEFPDDSRGAIAERLGLDPNAYSKNLYKVRKRVCKLLEANSDVN